MTSAEIPPRTWDLIVVDSTSAGLIAAIAAAGEGLAVLIVTEDLHPGAMQTSGLGNTNAGQRPTVGGLTRRFHERIHAHYVERYGIDSEQVKRCSDGFHFEPHVAEAVYLVWLAEAGVTLCTNARVCAVRRTGQRLTAIDLEDGRRFTAMAFIDASYEGDLLDLAGCTTHFGREAQSRYAEELAGIRAPEAELGLADRRTQPFDYRLCLCNLPTNRLPIPQPAAYDPAEFAWHAWEMSRREPHLLGQVLPLNHMPNHKTDSRSGEWIGHGDRWTFAGPNERRQIAAEHRQYCLRWLHWLRTDAPMPSAVRDELLTWGLAADEFQDNGNWPYHLYIRESRRLVGDWVMTQNDVTDERFKDDVIALGSFYLDVHPIRLIHDPDHPGQSMPEGSLGPRKLQPYEIPYRALLPRRTEALNLWSVCALSASHVAFSTLRMEPVWMMLGHAAGLAVALAAGAPAQDVPVERLQEKLATQGQILSAQPFNDFFPS